MKMKNKLQIMEKENTELKSEIDFLKKMLNMNSTNKQAELLERLEDVIEEKKEEVNACKDYKRKYQDLCLDLEKMKRKYKKEMRSIVGAIGNSVGQL